MIPIINYVALKSIRHGGVYKRHDINHSKLIKALIVAQTDARKLSIARRINVNSQFRNISNWVASQGAVSLREMPELTLNEINAAIEYLKLKQKV